MVAATRAFARIENGETQRIVVAQQASQLRGRQPVGSPYVIDECHQAFVGIGIETAVTDEVEDVPLLAPQRLLKLPPRRGLQPRDLEQAAGLKVGRRLLDAELLALDVELRQVGAGWRSSPTAGAAP